MAADNPLLILGVTILLLIVVGLCLTMAVGLLKAAAGNRDRDSYPPTGAVQRFDAARGPAQTPPPDDRPEPAAPEIAAPKRKFSNAEMAEYWRGEGIQAIKADQIEASTDAHWKSEYYRHLARHEQKAAAAERRRKRIEAAQGGKKPK